MPSFGTIFVSLILLAIFAAVLRYMFASKKNGGGCGCSGCTGCSAQSTSEHAACCQGQHHS